MTERVRVVLASASPARRETLRRAGLEVDVVVSGVAESGVEDLEPAAAALRLARRKARAVAATIAADPHERVLVVGCDSVLELDGQAHGKPASPDDAVARWRIMRGRDGTLHTGHCVIDLPSGAEVAQVGSTTVTFADLDDDEIHAYVASGEPLQVAGAFTIDGLGSAFVTGVDGDPHNVVGVSVPLLRSLVTRLGIRWTDLWAAVP